MCATLATASDCSNLPSRVFDELCRVLGTTGGRYSMAAEPSTYTYVYMYTYVTYRLRARLIPRECMRCRWSRASVYIGSI